MRKEYFSELTTGLASFGKEFAQGKIQKTDGTIINRGQFMKEVAITAEFVGDLLVRSAIQTPRNLKDHFSK